MLQDDDSGVGRHILSCGLPSDRQASPPVCANKRLWLEFMVAARHMRRYVVDIVDDGDVSSGFAYIRSFFSKDCR
jgi:hypothetical protein